MTDAIVAHGHASSEPQVPSHHEDRLREIDRLERLVQSSYGIRGGAASSCAEEDVEERSKEDLIAYQVLEGFLAGNVPSNPRPPRPRGSVTLLEEIHDKRVGRTEDAAER